MDYLYTIGNEVYYNLNTQQIKHKISMKDKILNEFYNKFKNKIDKFETAITKTFFADTFESTITKLLDIVTPDAISVEIYIPSSIHIHFIKENKSIYLELLFENEKDVISVLAIYINSILVRHYEWSVEESLEKIKAYC